MMVTPSARPDLRIFRLYSLRTWADMCTNRQLWAIPWCSRCVPGDLWLFGECAVWRCSGEEVRGREEGGGVLAPAGTPSSIINRLHSSVLKIIQSPEARQRLDELAFAPIGDTPSQFAAFIKSEVALWAKVVKASGATVD